jgi:hypothetical protein
VKEKARKVAMQPSPASQLGILQSGSIRNLSERIDLIDRGVVFFADRLGLHGTALVRFTALHASYEGTPGTCSAAVDFCAFQHATGKRPLAR